MVTIEVMELHATCTIIDLKIMNTVFHSPTKEKWITNTLNEYMRNLYSNEYYLIIRENKAWKKKPKTKKNKTKKPARTGVQPLIFATPVQRSTNWADKLAGSWSFFWFVIKPWSNK